ncbi:hypothetical protein V6N13_030924 [Hibiscus sabdariffa]|uniref:Uncharacterized protein n=1 Tax=Hibiscus sabdariffa TaxID=183260 RepID=A0ABR2CLW1_9ROSI
MIGKADLLPGPGQILFRFYYMGSPVGVGLQRKFWIIIYKVQPCKHGDRIIIQWSEWTLTILAAASVHNTMVSNHVAEIEHIAKIRRSSVLNLHSS